ncbi:hypothetical protein [uncultured Maricaulis sp.]|uniref:hypothetical protein n=1 Tax=uncultured Maricaulis sp. TaxID=174710 RepID=UPI0025F7760A|nr:hypothetical protein [uncultured Maricaulis sp.]
MRILVLMASLLMLPALTGAAEANCHWQVSTRLLGHQPGVGSISSQTWPLANINVRVQARTPGGFWNTPNWPAVTSDGDGFATLVSAIAFADPDCQTARDVRVQVRNFNTGMSWRTVHQQSLPGHGDHVGLFAPAPTHAVTVGNLVLDGPYRGDGVIVIENIGDPPAGWETSGDEPQDVPAVEPVDPQAADAPSQPDRTGAILDADPCHVYRLPIVAGVEFRFGQMPAQPGPLSADNALRISTRPNGGGAMTLNRLTYHVHVENAGQRDFHALHHCPVELHVRLNEGPGQRSGDGWSLPFTTRIPDLAVNAVVALDDTANLLGAGDDFVGAWSQDYAYVLIEVTLDATNRVRETAEGDNRIVHCYHAPSNSFADMAACQGD